MSKYEQRGASAGKEEVHAAIKSLDKGLYPMAFCKVLPDYLAGDSQHCNIIHADTAGTKTSLAYIYWKETNDLSVWSGIAQDALIMNIDDLGCIACINDIVISSTIGRNKHNIPGSVLQEIILGTQKLLDMFQSMGINIISGGGETADVGDIVRTVDVGITATARMKRSDVLVNNICAGDAVVGLSSSGISTYETEYNSGIGSNGLTLARHDVLDKRYATKYPESFSPETDSEYVYTGSAALSDLIQTKHGNISLGKLLLSPTRTYLPIIKKVIESNIPLHGMIHCSGGGQTKVLKFLNHKKVIKDNLLEIPEIFNVIQSQSNTSWEEMYKVFNMGHRLEIYCHPDYVQQIIDISNSFNIHAQNIGRVEEALENEVELISSKGKFQYK